MPSTSSLSLDLPGGACLEVDTELAVVHFRDAVGREASFRGHPASCEGTADLCCGLGEGGLLFADRRGSAVHHLRADPPQSTSHGLGERVPGAEQLSLHSVGDGFLVLTESGVTWLDGRGRQRFRIDERTYDWRFEGAGAGQFFFSDAHGNLLAFDRESGMPSSS